MNKQQRSFGGFMNTTSVIVDGIVADQIGFGPALGFSTFNGRSFRKRLLMGAFVAAATSVSTAAWAQEQAAQPGALEEVIVSGFRMSLQQAAEMKREADVVADVISA